MEALATVSYTHLDVYKRQENGFAQTKDMPYGIYTVKQTSGWEGRELMKPLSDNTGYRPGRGTAAERRRQRGGRRKAAAERRPLRDGGRKAAAA